MTISRPKKIGTLPKNVKTAMAWAPLRGTAYVSQPEEAALDALHYNAKHTVLEHAPLASVIPTKTVIHHTIDEGTIAYQEGGFCRITPGEILHDRYKVLRKIGYGKFSTVWAAVDMVSGTLRAIKISRSNPEDWNVARNEYDVMCKIHSKVSELFSDSFPSIEALPLQAVYDVFRHPAPPNSKHVCLVVEFLGCSTYRFLQQYTRRRSSRPAIPVPIVKTFARHLLVALGYVHAAGYVHTDVKPENLCLKYTLSELRTLDTPVFDCRLRTTAVAPSTADFVSLSGLEQMEIAAYLQSVSPQTTVRSDHHGSLDDLLDNTSLQVVEGPGNIYSSSSYPLHDALYAADLLFRIVPYPDNLERKFGLLIDETSLSKTAIHLDALYSYKNIPSTEESQEQFWNSLTSICKTVLLKLRGTTSSPFNICIETTQQTKEADVDGDVQPQRILKKASTTLRAPLPRINDDEHICVHLLDEATVISIDALSAVPLLKKLAAAELALPVTLKKILLAHKRTADEYLQTHSIELPTCMSVPIVLNGYMRGKTLHIQEGLDPYNHVIVNGHQFAVARKGSVDCIDDIVVELKHFDPRKAASIAVYKQSRYAFSSYLAMLNCCYDDYYMSDHHHINIGGSFTSNPWGQSRPPARPETCTGEVNGSNETASMAASFVSTSYSHECSRTHTRQGSQISSEWSVEHDSSADGEGIPPFDDAICGCIISSATDTALYRPIMVAYPDTDHLIPLLPEMFSVKLIDLGNSHRLGDTQPPLIQTAPYRAPEVILGLPFDEKADVWSVGCVIYEFLTGHILFPTVDMSSGKHISDAQHMCDILATVPFPGTEYFQASPLGLSLLEDECTKKYLDATAHFSLQLRLEQTGFTREEACLAGSFLEQLLTVDHKKRPSATQMLEHPWLSTHGPTDALTQPGGWGHS